MRSHLQQRIEARVVYARQRLVLDTENRVLARGLSVAQMPLWTFDEVALTVKDARLYDQLRA